VFFSKKLKNLVFFCFFCYFFFMKERVKKLREFLGLSHKDFGDKLSSSAALVYAWENGSSPLVDAKLKLICATWGVSEDWLRTGEGEMFSAQPPPAALAQDEQELIDMFHQLMPEIKELVLRRLRELVRAIEPWGEPDPQSAEGERSA
jgi:transcriptional regulator with XRE-family HTH domain